MSQDNPQLEAPDDPANEQPLVAHLIELRNRLMKSVIAIIVVFACLSPFMKQIFDFLSQPLMVALPQGAKLCGIPDCASGGAVSSLGLHCPGALSQ